MSELTPKEREALEPVLLSNNEEVDWLEDEVYPAVERIVDDAEAQLGEQIAREIEAARSTHWQEHLVRHPWGNGMTDPVCYAKHDAYFHAAAIARAALDPAPTTDADTRRDDAGASRWERG